MLDRHVTPRLREALSDTPVVFLQGPRQSGKTSLAKSMVEGGVLDRFVSLDEALHRSAANLDPEGFLGNLPRSVVIDEVQLAPGLFRAIKASVDRDRRPGRFLLTGSADILLVPGLADPLVGRMEPLTLWPLSQAELEGRESTFIERAFTQGTPWPAVDGGRGDAIDRILRGGFPEATSRPAGSRPAGSRPAAWFRAYVNLLLQRDVRSLAEVEGLAEMPRLLSLLAARAPGLVNFAEISRSLGFPRTTLKRYVALLEAAMVFRFLPAWSSDRGRRLVKAPRLLPVDTGLTCHLLGAGKERVESDPHLFGALLQIFATLELMKEAAATRPDIRLLHYRSVAGREVDLVLEDEAGRVVGVEMKAAITVGPGDFLGLRALAEDAGSRFVRGILLHGGRETTAFGKNFHALPLEALWS